MESKAKPELNGEEREKERRVETPVWEICFAHVGIQSLAGIKQ